jgi:hypothetical protein
MSGPLKVDRGGDRVGLVVGEVIGVRDDVSTPVKLDHEFLVVKVVKHNSVLSAKNESHDGSSIKFTTDFHRFGVERLGAEPGVVFSVGSVELFNDPVLFGNEPAGQAIVVAWAAIDFVCHADLKSWEGQPA